MPYALSEEIVLRIQLHKDYCPTRDQLKTFIRSRFNAGMSRDNFTSARAGRITARPFLIHLLTFLQEETSFAEEVLDEDWGNFDVADLEKRCVIEVPVGYRPKYSSFKMSDGPEPNIPLLIPAWFLGNSKPASTLQEVKAAARTLAVACGDLINNDADPDGPLAPVDEAIEIGYQLMNRTLFEIEDDIANSIRYCPDSVWINMSSDPDKHMASQVIPLSEETYRQFIAGEINDSEIVKLPPCERSNKLLINAAFGDFRRAKFGSTATLMTMVLRQIGILSPWVFKDGVKFVSFATADHTASALEGWGFKPTGKKMKGYAHVIMEMEIKATDQSLPVWAFLLAYQSFALAGESMKKGFDVVTGRSRSQRSIGDA